MTNTFPANSDRRELSQVSLICKIKRHVTLLAPESVGENSFQLKLLFLKAVLVGRRGKADKGDGRCNRVKGPAPPSLHQVPTPKTCRGRPAPRGRGSRSDTTTHARAPRPRARTRPEAPAAATGTRAVLAAPTSLPPLGSRRLPLPAPLHAGPADLEVAAAVGGLWWAQRVRRRRQERGAAAPSEFPGGDVAGRGPLRKAGAATGRPVRRRWGRPQRSAWTRHGLRHVLTEQVQ